MLYTKKFTQNYSANTLQFGKSELRVSNQYININCIYGVTFYRLFLCVYN